MSIAASLSAEAMARYIVADSCIHLDWPRDVKISCCSVGSGGCLTGEIQLKVGEHYVLAQTSVIRCVPLGSKLFVQEIQPINSCK